MLVHYAGWTDKLAAVLGGVNPVAAPFLSFSLPEPTGVVGVVAPDEPELLGLVAELAPALAAGQHGRRGAVGGRRRWAGSTSARCWACPTCPAAWSTCCRAGAPSWRRRSAAHPASTRSWTPPRRRARGRDRRLAAESVTRVRHAAPTATYEAAVADALTRLEAVTELKTAWHPVGA